MRYILSYLLTGSYHPSSDSVYWLVIGSTLIARSKVFQRQNKLRNDAYVRCRDNDLIVSVIKFSVVCL